MVALPNLVPVSTGLITNVFVDDGPNPSLAHHQRVTDASDTTFVINSRDAAASIMFGLSDLPADWASMDTLGFDIRLRLDGVAVDDQMTITAAVYDGNATTTPMTNVVTVATQMSALAAFNAKTGAFTLAGTFTKAQWDNAHLRLAWTSTRTMGADGLSIYVAEAKVTGTYTALVADTTAPGAVPSFTATPNGSTAINLAWTAATDNATPQGSLVYEVDRSLDGSTGWALVHTSTAGALAWSDTGRSPSTAYFYRIRARDTAGNRSATYATANATTAAKAASGGSTAPVAVTSTGAGLPGRAGASSAGVTVTASGAGVAFVAHRSGGSTASVGTTAVGGGSKGVSSGATGTVSTTATGSGTHGGRGGAASTVTVTSTGSGSPGRAGGSGAPVTVTATGGGTALVVPSGAGGSTASVAVAGVGAGTTGRAGGSTAAVGAAGTGAGTTGRAGAGTSAVTASGTGTGTPGRAGGGASTVTVTGAGAGTTGRAGGGTGITLVVAGGGGTTDRAGGGDTPVVVTAEGAGGSTLDPALWRNVDVAATAPELRGPVVVTVGELATVGAPSLRDPLAVNDAEQVGPVPVGTPEVRRGASTLDARNWGTVGAVTLHEELVVTSPVVDR